MVGKSKPASAGFLLPASCGLFCVWSVWGLFPLSSRELVGEATMQPRNYAATQACSKCSGNQARSWSVPKSLWNTRLITSCHFLALFKSKKYPNNNKIIYIYIYVPSVVLVLAKSLWEIFFFNFWGKLRRGDWDQALTFSYLVGFFFFQTCPPSYKNSTRF